MTDWPTPPSQKGLFCFFSWQRHLQVLSVLSASPGMRTPPVNAASAALLSGLEHPEWGSPDRMMWDMPSGEAWLLPCPVHASQNRKGHQSSGIVGWNVKSGHLDSKVFIILVKISRQTTALKNQFPLSLRSNCAKSYFSSLSGLHQWIIGGTSRWETSFCSLHMFSDPVLLVLKFLNDFFICRF